jgi:hypothetical protein
MFHVSRGNDKNTNPNPASMAMKMNDKVVGRPPVVGPDKRLGSLK